MPAIQTIHSYAIDGVRAVPVTVQGAALITDQWTIEGLPEVTAKEVKVRVKCALAESGHRIRGAHVRVTAPPGVRVRSEIDLAVALSLVPGFETPETAECAYVGSLALNGRLERARGAVPMMRAALAEGRRLVLPRENGAEWPWGPGEADTTPIRSAETLSDIIGPDPFLWRPVPRDTGANDWLPCTSEVRGQREALEALETAAKQGLNVLFVGPPGAGATMLARRLPGILPLLSDDEALEVAEIQSVAGLYRGGRATRPFRAPHSTCSEAALYGGGIPAHPGEVSLAHHGVLSLDDLPEFRPAVLERLWDVQKAGEVVVSRLRHETRYPARFQVVASMMPCPCGHRGSATVECCCADGATQRYRERLADLVIPHFQLIVTLPPVSYANLRGPATNETSETIRARVTAARAGL